MLEQVKKMTLAEFAYWYQRANGYQHSAFTTNAEWEKKQRAIVRFLEEVEKHEVNRPEEVC